MHNRKLPRIILISSVFLIIAAPFSRVQARPRPSASPAAQAETASVAIDADDIGGVVTSSQGPEAGVWVIAETTAFQSKFRKIVVTDDHGRYVVPDLAAGVKYKVWVRGYGLVDSQPVETIPGKNLALTAVIAPDARAAAQYYPANYWFSLMQMPPKDAFPIGEVKSQEQWVDQVKGCIVCHQIGDKATREIEPQLGTFPSSTDAWRRRLQSGQIGRQMTGTVSRLGGLDRGLSFYADWTDRIAAGEVPAAPPRPQGLERNVVVSSWDVGEKNAFIHDIGSSDKRKPTVNANGPVYGVDWHNNTMVILDPVESTNASIPIPTREALDPITTQDMLAPSPYFGNELYSKDITVSDTPMIDSQGRVWMSDRMRKPDNPDYCWDGTKNAYARHFPLRQNFRQAAYYDPKTKTIHTVDTCFPTHHLNFAYDRDDTLYFHGPGGGFGGVNAAPELPPVIGWIKTRVLLQTGNEQAAQGWCPAYVDVDGDGTIDPKVDKPILGSLYAVVPSPSEPDVVWATSPSGVPGHIIRFHLGATPETCTAEVYEPPYNNPKAPGVRGSLPRGLDVDMNGVVWAALSDSSQMASFDRRKCKVLTGEAATTGQQCPEGWTLYRFPGPNFKGVTEQNTAEWSYYTWVDRYNTLGFGANVAIANGTNSDSLMVFNPTSKTWTVMRVPYPMGFYQRGMDGRIDDPKTGWKGRGMWADDGSRAVWHREGGPYGGSMIVHFQVRPDPLAN